MNARTLNFFAISALAAILAACSSVPLDEQEGSRSGDGDDAASSSGVVMDPFDPESPLAQNRSVYFEFDSYSIPDQYRDLVETHAKYLSSNADQDVRIEGHADERGGSEYNLALGQRRSDAVRRMMTLLGVNDSQIEAISFGKERPKALGHTDADYAENRRADIEYQQ